jgi:hypothetical protein
LLIYYPSNYTNLGYNSRNRLWKLVCPVESGLNKQIPLETFVGDISIIQRYTELNLPNAFAKINSAGIFSLIVRSGATSAWSGRRSKSPPLLVKFN